MTTLIMKFGGNVLGTPTGIREALEIIAAQQNIWDDIVIVTSALSSVTDALYNIVQTAQNGSPNAFRADVAELREMHRETASFSVSNPDALRSLLQELDVLFFNLLDDCDLIRQKSLADPAVADRVVAMGEMFVTRIAAAGGRERGLKCAALDASRLIITDDRFGNARPINSLSQQALETNLLPLLDRGIIPIVTGYMGANERGEVTTLGRGGSDYSATYLGALLAADEVWFFSDVDGLMSADPAVVPKARMIPTSSYREVAEMARFGARVLHPRAIEPLIQANIPLRIRSVTDPGNTGTYIFNHTPPQEFRIHAITQARGLLVNGTSQSNMTEVCNRLISQYINDDIQPTLQVDVHSGSHVVYVAPTSANQEKFHESIKHLQSYDSGMAWQAESMTVIAVIGALNQDDHIEILKTLSKANIKPELFGSGSEGVFLLVVSADAAEAALNHLHKLIQK